MKFLTWFKGEYVGQDLFKNKYYRTKNSDSSKERRWVVYKGMSEPSKIPAEWHGWLHHTTLFPPDLEKEKKWPWEKNHLPNLSGTTYAYHPPGFYENKRQKATGDYEAWQPHGLKDEN